MRESASVHGFEVSYLMVLMVRVYLTKVGKSSQYIWLSCGIQEIQLLAE